MTHRPLTSQSNEIARPPSAESNGAAENEPLAEKIAVAILDGPRRVREGGLPAWSEDLEILKPEGTRCTEDRNEDCLNYQRALEHRQKVNHLCRCVAEVANRDRNGRTPLQQGKHERQKLLRVGEFLLSLVRAILKAHGRVAYSVFEFLGGKWAAIRIH